MIIAHLFSNALIPAGPIIVAHLDQASSWGLFEVFLRSSANNKPRVGVAILSYYQRNESSFRRFPVSYRWIILIDP